MPRTISIANKEVDLYKTIIKILAGLLFTLLSFQASQLYLQVQDQAKDLARLRRHIIILENKVGVEKKLRESSTQEVKD
jgi:hypothetical protein